MKTTIKKTSFKYSINDESGEWITKVNFYDYKLKNFDWILIANLDTKKKYQKQGFATKLMKELSSDLKKKYPNKGMYLFVKIDNCSAIKLYKKLGFKKIKTYQLKNGKYDIMVKGNADTKQFNEMNFS